MKLFTKNIRYIDLQQIHDNRDGIINIAEASNQIPFNIKRVYSITGLKKNSDSRGHHAHKNFPRLFEQDYFWTGMKAQHELSWNL